jgi:hypothetical protein
MFRKYCEICGVQLKKGKGVVRFGKYFCSEEHAEQYAREKQVSVSKTHNNIHGGCCC